MSTKYKQGSFPVETIMRKKGSYISFLNKISEAQNIVGVDFKEYCFKLGTFNNDVKEVQL